jgi:hypothetical protein
MKISQPCSSLIFSTCLIAVYVIEINGFVLRPSQKFRTHSRTLFATAVSDEKTNKFLLWAQKKGIGTSHFLTTNR